MQILINGRVVHYFELEIARNRIGKIDVIIYDVTLKNIANVDAF